MTILSLAGNVGPVQAADAPPAPPAFVGATPISSNQVNVAWPRSLGGIVAQSYNIFRNGMFVGHVLADNSVWINPSFFQDRGLSANTAYTYTVTAIGDDGKESAPSTETTVTTPASLSGLIPDNRIADWRHSVSVGVPGGPRQRTRIINVVTDFGADNTGARTAHTAVQAAINSAPADSVVYLPEGTYRFDGAVSVNKNNITIRGAGPDKTIIDAYGVGIFVGTTADWQWNNTTPITGSPAKGPTPGCRWTEPGLPPPDRDNCTELTISNTGVFAPFGSPIPNGGVGALVQIVRKNDVNVPVVSVAGFEYVQRQMSRIVRVNGGNITVSPALHFDLPAALEPLMAVATQQISFSGVEDLNIDGTHGGGQELIQMAQSFGCWISNVVLQNSSKRTMAIRDSLQSTLQNSYLWGDLADHGYVLSLDGRVSNCLVENNIIRGTSELLGSSPNSPIQINAGASGNVFGYNYMSGPIFTNHNPQNSFNLYEGNVNDAGYIISDGYFGGESETTFFRNLISFLALKRFSRNFNVVGNLTTGGYALGQPNIGNAGYAGFVAPSADRYWMDWNKSGSPLAATITSRYNVTAWNGEPCMDCGVTMTLTSGQLAPGQAPMMKWNGGQVWVSVSEANGNVVKADSTAWSNPPAVSIPLPPPGTAVTFWPGSGGFQEWDLDVMTTTLFKANHEGSGVPASQTLLPGEVLPDSLYLPSKPSWFGNLTWPAFDPTRPNRSIEAIPAGYRLTHEPRPPSVRGGGPAGSGGSEEQLAFLLFKSVFNPLKEMMTIKYRLKDAGGTMTVYDRGGREVKKLEVFSNGETSWDGRNTKNEVVASGIYILSLTSGGSTVTRKVVVLK